ncbi:nucleoside-diphosphate sugar epimerase [Rhizobium sp. R72]|uniref:SDR family oxidoreductase n=1 Tax=unclassified Rhizobium TaxID=2613769 RepID=UPI000B52D4AC|nr:MULTISPECIES: SDR family oxidoreductase [unclassified Rhizobium]OWV92835.1 nucleoside-diphosphate sugar epimerase [Rhizobium sp. R72]OWV93046.1 nucleoside-diphosphate sugar epimerase [Rhizobium sp. R711]
MRIVILGASGLIGSATVSRLQRSHTLVGIARDVEVSRQRFPMVEWRSMDLSRSTGALKEALAGAEAVVNCVGALQDAPGENLSAIHEDVVSNIIMACRHSQAVRIIHISAVGVDRDPTSRFSTTKQRSEEVLKASGLTWVILRPSVVLGRPVFGASALMRGLAALPVMPVMPATGPLQVVQLDDVVATIEYFVQKETAHGIALDLVGPTRHSFTEIVQLYRQWLGWSPAHEFMLPHSFAKLTYRFGDAIGKLGWRPPVRSNAELEIARGAVGDPTDWTRVTSIIPRSLPEALAEQPATVQERWFALLYLLRPLVFIILAAFWITTGLVSIGPGYQIGLDLMFEGGAKSMSGPSVIAGGLTNLLIGVGIAFRRTTRIALFAALGISLFYAVAGSLLLPRLWIEPLGPLTKIWPIVMLNLVALVILRDR